MIFMLSMSFAFGQPYSFDTKYYSVNDGLSDHRINNILQHSNGFVYVGTRNGLDRFDGYRFQKIDLPKRSEFMLGSAEPGVNNLIELPDQKILIKYFNSDKDADVYDWKNNTFVNVPILVEGNYLFYNNSKDTVLLKERRNMDLYGNKIIVNDSAGHRSAFLQYKTGQQIDLTHIYFPTNKSLNFYWRPNGRDFTKLLYLGSFNGMVKLDIKKSQFKTYMNEKAEAWEYPVSCRTITQLDKDRVLLCPENRPSKILNRSTGSLETLPFQTTEGIPFPKDDFRAVHLLNDSLIFIAQQYYGFYLVNLKTNIAKWIFPEHFDLEKIMASILLPDGRIIAALYPIKEASSFNQPIHTKEGYFKP